MHFCGAGAGAWQQMENRWSLRFSPSLSSIDSFCNLRQFPGLQFLIFEGAQSSVACPLPRLLGGYSRVRPAEASWKGENHV